MTTATQLASDHFASGLYCAESVLLALAQVHGMETEVLPRIATGFCGGMARTCGTCGALTGGIMGLGLVLGRNAPGEPYEACFQATQRLVRAFEAEFGSRNCAMLLGCDLGTPEGQTHFYENNLKDFCHKVTARTAELAVEALAKV